MVTTATRELLCEKIRPTTKLYSSLRVVAIGPTGYDLKGADTSHFHDIKNQRHAPYTGTVRDMLKWLRAFPNVIFGLSLHQLATHAHIRNSCPPDAQAYKDSAAFRRFLQCIPKRHLAIAVHLPCRSPGAALYAHNAENLRRTYNLSKELLKNLAHAVDRRPDRLTYQHLKIAMDLSTCRLPSLSAGMAMQVRMNVVARRSPKRLLCPAWKMEQKDSRRNRNTGHCQQGAVSRSHPPNQGTDVALSSMLAAEPTQSSSKAASSADKGNQQSSAKHDSQSSKDSTKQHVQEEQRHQSRTSARSRSSSRTIEQRGHKDRSPVRHRRDSSQGRQASSASTPPPKSTPRRRVVLTPSPEPEPYVIRITTKEAKKPTVTSQIVVPERTRSASTGLRVIVPQEQTSTFKEPRLPARSPSHKAKASLLDTSATDAKDAPKKSRRRRGSKSSAKDDSTDDDGPDPLLKPELVLEDIVPEPGTTEKYLDLVGHHFVYDRDPNTGHPSHPRMRPHVGAESLLSRPRQVCSLPPHDRGVESPRTGDNLVAVPSSRAANYVGLVETIFEATVHSFGQMIPIKTLAKYQPKMIRPDAKCPWPDSEDFYNIAEHWLYLQYGHRHIEADDRAKFRWSRFDAHLSQRIEIEGVHKLTAPAICFVEEITRATFGDNLRDTVVMITIPDSASDDVRHFIRRFYLMGTVRRVVFWFGRQLLLNNCMDYYDVIGELCHHITVYFSTVEQYFVLPAYMRDLFCGWTDGPLSVFVRRAVLVPHACVVLDHYDLHLWYRDAKELNRTLPKFIDETGRLLTGQPIAVRKNRMTRQHDLDLWCNTIQQPTDPRLDSLPVKVSFPQAQRPKTTKKPEKGVPPPLSYFPPPITSSKKDEGGALSSLLDAPSSSTTAALELLKKSYGLDLLTDFFTGKMQERMAAQTDAQLRAVEGAVARAEQEDTEMDDSDALSEPTPYKERDPEE
ncbi:hypothetical protein AAVH_22378 [Aphelenchoides avenae]|nr:hypothetical protein AAVH_22378 [Aphelenchus avenae]